MIVRARSGLVVVAGGISRSRSALAACALISGALLAISAAAEAGSPDPLAVAFGTMPALWKPHMSPDGSKVSLLKMHPDDLPILMVVDLEKAHANLALASTPDGFDINWCQWANNERLLCGFRGVGSDLGVQYGATRLVAVNADGSDMRVLLQQKGSRRFEQFHDEVTDLLVADPRRVLIPEGVEHGTVIKPLDIYSGGTESAIEKLLGSGGWMTDGRGKVRLFLHVDRYDLAWRYRRAGDGEWHDLHEWKRTDVQHAYSPVGFGDDPDQLLVLKPHEGRVALWSVDLKNGAKEKLIYSHPEVDVDGVLQIGKFKRTVAVSYSTDRPHLEFFDPTVAEIVTALSDLFEDKVVDVIDESWDRRYYLVYVGSDRDPGTYYRFDVKQQQLMQIAVAYPQLQSHSLAEMKPVRYPARDGVEIPGYLTLPPGKARPLPAVIYSHGGPSSRDDWAFDWLAQFIAAKGYAVLQSNYRGSSGYGADWEGEGGYREWRRAINDITDGAQYLVDQGIADPQRICAVGWSYGGYAALMSGIEQPERYRCIVSIAGVTDLEMKIKDARFFSNRKEERAWVSGHPDVIQQGSPAKRADAIRVPVLLFHGDLDLNVPVEHSRKIAKLLEDAHKPVEYIEYEGATHSIWRNGYQVDMLDRIGAFLDANTRPPTPSSNVSAVTAPDSGKP